MDLTIWFARAAVALGAVTVFASLVTVVPAARRTHRRALGLVATARSGKAEVEDVVRHLQVRWAETQGALLPWRRAHRWLRHPLVSEFLRWCWRRRPRAGRRG
ncbi:MAG TPA: hypothetical protein VKY90_09980 [Candidatus Dormibacteraeota bacterium]|nr:hypothetical protein [Candidatus Dormibacteraeota bacterium]